jgi:hypothetical protein
MYIKKRVCLILLALLSLTVLLTCTPVENKFEDKELAAITRDKSLVSLPDSITVGRVYPCSVAVILYFYFTEYRVSLKSSAFDTLIASGTPQSNTIAFNLIANTARICTLQVVMTRETGTTDTLLRPLTAYVPISNSPPSITTDSSMYHCEIGKSISIPFVTVDADSNLNFASITLSDTAYERDFTVKKSHRDTIVVSVSPRSPQPIACRVLVVDKYLFTAEAACSIMVFDTSKPAIAFLSPDTTIAHIADSLPIHIRARVVDQSGIDSAVCTYGIGGGMKRQMTIIADTVTFDVSDLDSGNNVCSIAVWDLFGNTAAFPFRLKYAGVKKYPPKIDSLPEIVRKENQPFDNIFVDSIVTITDPAASYDATKLIWSFTKDAVSGLQPLYNSATRRLNVGLAPADSEWNGSQKITFIVTSPNGLSDSRQFTFTITPINDKPQIKDKTIYRSLADTLFIDTLAIDPDNKGRELTWSFVPGNNLKIVTAGVSRIDPFEKFNTWNTTRHITTMRVDTTTFIVGIGDSIQAIVKDPLGLADTAKLVFMSGIHFINDPIVKDLAIQP